MKLIAKTLCLAVALGTASLGAASFGAAQWPGGNDNRVFVDGIRLHFGPKEHPYWDQGTMLVPFRALAAKVGAKVGRSKSGERVWIECQGNHLEFSQGHVDFWLNGNRVPLTTSSEDRGGILFVPIRLFTAITGHRVTFDRNGDRNGN